MADYYKHFKGGKYKLLGIAKDSETLKEAFMQRFTKITEEEALGE